MKEPGKTKKQLLQEIRDLRRRVIELENIKIQHERTEKALRESEERLRLALEGAHEGLWDWNVNTGEHFYDSVWAEITGNDPAGIGQHIDAPVKSL